MRLSTLFLIGCLACPAPAFADTNAAGVGVGSGAVAVDPSKNVLDALLAAVTRLNDLMNAAEKRDNDLRAVDIKYQDALREAETRRVNELAAHKQNFDSELARIIRADQDSNALLLAGQVKDLKVDTGDRMSKLEEFANQQRGRSEGGAVVWYVISIAVGLLIAVGGIFLGLRDPRHRDGPIFMQPVTERRRRPAPGAR